MQKPISENSNSSVNDLSNDDKIDFTEILAILMDSKWLIASVVGVALVIGVAKSFLDTRIYKSDAMLQVEAYLQPLSALPKSGEGELLKNEIPIMAEIELINSRTVLGAAIKNLNLDIVVKPNYFPIVGEAIARRFNQNNKEKRISDPLFGQSQYAWGGESIQVDTFTVPTNMLDKQLTLVADKPGYFRLMYKDALILEGEVGKLASKQLEDKEEYITIFVSQLKARSDTQFSIIRQSESNAITQLKSNLQVAEKTKLSRILELTMEATSPESTVRILNEIINIFIRQNVEQKSAEAQQTLEFLKKQMPLLKEQLDMSTGALNEYRTRKGSIDLNIETQGLLDGVVKVKTEITLLQQKRDELRQKFTESHPSVVAIDKQIARLESQINANDHKIEVLPETQQVILKLSRDVKVNTELYTTLLNHAQTLRVAKAGTVGDVRIIDYAALPNLPIKPKKTQIVAIALILGLFLGVALAFIRKALRRGVEDPDLIENKLHIPVYATIPHSFDQEKLSKKVNRNYKRESNDPVVLALQNRDDIAIESLRSLRTTLHFAFLEAQNNIIMITGPSPGVGKTFVSINLAAVLADSGKKILLIDGDMRKGYINKALGVGRGNGLSELISNSISGWSSLLELAIHRIPSVNFDFISTGAIPPNPSELLLHERFSKLLESISKSYDHIIIDSPPILAVTDASIIGRLASATLMVVKSGQHPMRELEHSAKRLTQAGVHLKGIVFNDLPEASSQHGYEYGYTKYMYQYSSKQ
jgi:tyrosine-protein kinase Etk/Wzc